MAPDQFIADLLPAARTCHRQTGIPASFTIAQAALESAWGASKLAKRGCNLFGVKADRAWKGPAIYMDTAEVINGQRMMVPAAWRCYDGWLPCLIDRAEFFKRNPRYAACWRETTGEGWARAVAAAGYATDPDYAAKIISVIRAHNLARYDAPADKVAA